MKKIIKNIILKIPYINKRFLPPNYYTQTGHFYSPVPNLNEVKEREDIIWKKLPKEIFGIDLNTDEQLKILNIFKEFYKDIPFTPEKNDKLNYYYENPSFSYTDAIFLHSMIRYLKPKRIIEVGSGFSSAVIFDTNRLFFNNSIKLDFVEPYSQTFNEFKKQFGSTVFEHVHKIVQDVPYSFFETLEAGDILFIDSSHISKIGSDLNYLFLEILPRLKKGVYIHIHDIFYPFEYPKDWIYEGRAFNEAYILQAMLTNTTQYKIKLFSTYLVHFYRDFFEKNMPFCLRNPGGDIWIEKQ